MSLISSEVPDVPAAEKYSREEALAGLSPHLLCSITRREGVRQRETVAFSRTYLGPWEVCCLEALVPITTPQFQDCVH